LSRFRFWIRQHRLSCTGPKFAREADVHTLPFGRYRLVELGPNHELAGPR
jgi:hypothetical protein